MADAKADCPTSIEAQQPIKIELDKFGGETLMAACKDYAQRGSGLTLDIYIEGFAWFSDMETISFKVESGHVSVYGP